MTARIEHANFTVSDPQVTAEWMQKIFGWHIRWQGNAIAGGHTIHVGSDDQYLALYSPKGGATQSTAALQPLGSLNHVAVIVDDIEVTDAALTAHGFKTFNHDDYEPGRRFYFYDQDNIEFEVVQYD